MPKNAWKYLFSVLTLFLCLIWLSIFSYPDDYLHLVACDVGQGDATLISLGKTQFLIDGGPDGKVIDCLSRYMPFWDRKLEGVILTHPDLDHYGGLTEVIKRYEVDNFLYNGTSSGSESYQVLEKEVGGRGISTTKVGKGSSVRVGKMYLDILNPDQTNLNYESNDNSLVIAVKYQDFEAILTGDAPREILNKILPEGEVNYIKISHHGSKTGTDKELLDRIVPKLAVISVGNKNRYGHPDDEVIKILKENGIMILRTDELGSIEIVVDESGNYWLSD